MTSDDAGSKMRTQCGWSGREPGDRGAETLWTPQIRRPSPPQRGLINTQRARGHDGEIRGDPEGGTPATQQHMEGILAEISVH